MFEAVGALWGDINDFLMIARRVSEDLSINVSFSFWIFVSAALIANGLGRSFAVGPRKVLDLGDDSAEQFSGIAMARFYKNELLGWDEKAAKMIAMIGV